MKSISHVLALWDPGAEAHSYFVTGMHACLVASLAIYTFFVFAVKNHRQRRLAILARIAEQYPKHASVDPSKRSWLDRLQTRYIDRHLRPFALLTVAFPAAALVALLRNDYVPAVLGMAIVAIVVAADHDAALEQAPRVVAESVKIQLGEIRKQIVRQISKDLKVATEKFQEASTEEAERLVGFSDSYRWWLKAKRVKVDSAVPRIIAVIHHWEMPTDLLTTSKSTEDPDPPLQEAFEVLSTAIRAPDPIEHDQIDHIAASNALPRFVCNGPTRLQGWLRNDGHEMRAFYGLVHALHMLYRVSNDSWKILGQRGIVDVDVRPAKIRVGTAPIWAHVIGDDVYHIVDSDTSAARARQLYNEVRDERHDALSRDRHASASAYTEALQLAFNRAASAESYVATILLATEMSKQRLEGPEFDAKFNPDLEWRDDLDGVLKTTPEDRGFRIESKSDLTFALTMMGARNKSYTAFLSEEAYRLWGGAVRQDIVLGKITLDESKALEKCLAELCGYLTERWRFLHRFHPIPPNWEEAGHLRAFLLDEVAR
jgi:hypothetical protein